MLRRWGGLGECDARTQGAPRWDIWARPRTPQRAAEHAPATQGFILIRVLSPVRERNRHEVGAVPSQGLTPPRSAAWVNQALRRPRRGSDPSVCGDVRPLPEIRLELRPLRCSSGVSQQRSALSLAAAVGSASATAARRDRLTERWRIPEQLERLPSAPVEDEGSKRLRRRSRPAQKTSRS